MARKSRGRKRSGIRSNTSSDSKKAKLGEAVKPTVAIAIVGLLVVSTIGAGILYLMSNNDNSEENTITETNYGVKIRALSNEHRVPAGKHDRNASKGVKPFFNIPLICDTKCITWEYLSILIKSVT